MDNNKKLQSFYKEFGYYIDKYSNRTRTSKKDSMISKNSNQTPHFPIENSSNHEFSPFSNTTIRKSAWKKEHTSYIELQGQQSHIAVILYPLIYSNKDETIEFVSIHFLDKNNKVLKHYCNDCLHINLSFHKKVSGISHNAFQRNACVPFYFDTSEELLDLSNIYIYTETKDGNRINCYHGIFDIQFDSKFIETLKHHVKRNKGECTSNTKRMSDSFLHYVAFNLPLVNIAAMHGTPILSSLLIRSIRIYHIFGFNKELNYHVIPIVDNVSDTTKELDIATNKGFYFLFYRKKLLNCCPYKINNMFLFHNRLKIMENSLKYIRC